MHTFKDIVTITSKSGLYILVAKRADGIIVRELSKQTNEFISNRHQQCTLLESIGIYMDNGETQGLQKIFNRILEHKLIVPNPKSDEYALRTFISSCLENYDVEKVHISHIRKIIQWYNLIIEKEISFAE